MSSKGGDKGRVNGWENGGRLRVKMKVWEM